MENKEIWNKIVEQYQKNYYNEEYKLQQLWMNIFGQYLHYNSLDSEICSTKSIRIGSSAKLIPDIIIQKDQKDFAIIELKKSTYNSCDNYRTQLFSYLKQLKLPIGVLITNKIELFVYDYTKDDNEQQSIEIDFVKDNIMGEQFVDLFLKEHLSLDSIRKAVNNKKLEKKDIEEITSITNEKLIKDLLTDYYYKQGYNKIAIDKYLSDTNINISRKIKINANVCDPTRYTTPTIHRYQQTGINRLDDYMSKNDAIWLCHKNKISLSQNITFANFSVVTYTYPANVQPSFLTSEWMLLLNDNVNKELHVLKIPAFAFRRENFSIRDDKGTLVLAINKSFEDIHPQQHIINNLYKYKIHTINYSE